LLVRERYAYVRPWARFIGEPTEVVSFVMSRKMLRGIKTRAECTAEINGEARDGLAISTANAGVEPPTARVGAR
jgi:hypothetical protein